MLDIDVEVLKKSSEELNEISYEIFSAKSIMDSVFEDIQTAWQSQYTDKYLQAYEDIADNINNTMKRVEELGGMLEKLASETIEAENNISEIMNQ